MTAAGGFVEIQGTAEQEAFSPEELAAMLALAKDGIADLCAKQQEALSE
jgi:ribonuclease PH